MKKITRLSNSSLCRFACPIAIALNLQSKSTYLVSCLTSAQEALLFVANYTLRNEMVAEQQENRQQQEE